MEAPIATACPFNKALPETNETILTTDGPKLTRGAPKTLTAHHKAELESRFAGF